MLDAETRARIDSARDILVGKVPDPKSQVEQITIALIYKFMDDMDRQSEELGGKATFFAGEFKKYRWANLLDRRLGGHERLLLYAEGIEKMNENKNIPRLFREIFKGVFLPYRDPETLNLFLKEIDGFTYDHSERLGDAYEYLLSVLGTQGDAGQFRTPRHIIDFIIAVVDPKKHETVLDPACGTAGFLISAFKHIMRNNESLTPDERARLMTNFRGYDIAPDMVRLSRVNMYLHGFPNPVIQEYDTLTSEERWDERSDVIMANPPFMTPKGGIRPHNRFSIKAKRSEVLFVDYIAEHLSPGGRAGVIVPEGIIFQSQKAYKNLRRMLLENYLWAVASLPAGVFNPYSGVKTSILFLDRNLAKRADDVLFVKVENDGFDLGAQRRPIEKNDVPEALKVLNDWKVEGAMKAGNKRETKATEKILFLTVPRKGLLESPDVNLSGDRYRPSVSRPSGKWPMVRVEEVCDLIGGGTPSKTERRFWERGTIKWISAKHINEEHAIAGWELITEEAIKESATNVIPSNAVVIVTRVSVGKITLLNEPVAINQDLTGLIVQDPDRLKPEFLFWAITAIANKIADSAQGLGVKGVTRQFMAGLEIPLPPLEEQERIVAELEGYRKVTEGARQVIASYKPTIRIDPGWPQAKLGSLTSLVSSGITPLGGKDNYLSDGILFIRSQNILKGLCDFSDAAHISVSKHESMSRTSVREQDVLLNITGASIGRCAVYKENRPANVSQHVCIIRLDRKQLDPDFLCAVVNAESSQDHIMQIQSGASRQALNFQQIRDLGIPVPPIGVQRQIVAELEIERTLLEANRALIARMEVKIRAKLVDVWGDSEDAA